MKMNEDQLQKQLEREELQQEWGKEEFRQKLAKQKSKRDYSRSAGSKALHRSFLDDIIDETKDRLTPYLDPSTVLPRADTIHRCLTSMMDLPLYDRIESEADGSITMVQQVGEDEAPVLVDAWDYEKAALIALRTALDTVFMPLYTMEEWKRGKRNGARPTLQQLQALVGKRIETECMITYARHQFPDSKYHTGFVTKVLKESYGRQAGIDQKEHNTRRRFKKIAADGFYAEIFDFHPWSNADHQVIGAEMLAIVQSATNITAGEDAEGGIFEVKPGSGGFNFLHLTEAGEAFVNRLDLKAESMAFVDLPMMCKPRPHQAGRSGGYLNLSGAMRRSTVKDTWKAELELSGQHRDFQNQQQDVALRICKPVLDIMEELITLPPGGRDVGSFVIPPTEEEYVTIQYPQNIQDKLDGAGKKSFSPEELELFETVKRQRAEQFKAYRPANREASMAQTAQTLRAARECRDDERFYIVVEDCFRGRFYCSSGNLSYQGRDYQKGLIEFADAIAVDDRTEWWMKVGLAGFMGLDKLSFSRRVEEVDKLRLLIIEAVRNPIHTDWWKVKGNVEKPWQWIQVAQEWVRLFVDDDTDRTTRCRVPVDATCSGQQLCAGWTESLATAQQVNLVDSPEPTDIYANILDVAIRGLRADDFVVTYKSNRSRQPILKRRLKALAATEPKRRGKARKGSKSILLVAQYGAGRPTRIRDFSKNTKLDWLKDDEQKFDFSESSAIYPYFQAGLDECVPALDALLDWIKSVVDAALKRTGAYPCINIPLSDGSVVKQLYPVQTSGRIETAHLSTYTKKDKKRGQNVDKVSTNEPDIDKHKSSTMANLVHGGDSCALVFAGAHLGEIPFTTNHDSVSGRPGREMDTIVTALKKGLHEVFQKNPLEKFVELNGLSVEDFPPPKYGDYDIDMVLTASYPYS